MGSQADATLKIEISNKRPGGCHLGVIIKQETTLRNYVEANAEYSRRGLFNRLYEAVELSGRCSFSPALGSAAESFWLQVVACKCRQMSSPVLLLLQGRGS